MTEPRTTRDVRVGQARAIALCLTLALAHLLSACGAASPMATKEERPAVVSRDLAEVQAHRDQIETHLTPDTVSTGEKESSDHAMTLSGADGGDSPQLDCRDACQISEDVCRSSETICEIASRHPTEREFVDTCDWAQGTCLDVRRDCSACGG